MFMFRVTGSFEDVGVGGRDKCHVVRRKIGRGVESVEVAK